MMMLTSTTLAVIIAAIIYTSFLLIVVNAHDNGLALTPPLGWRSWNLYGGSITQSKMISIMNGMVQRNRYDNNNNLISLCDLGYCDVGLDDVWQDCHSIKAAPGMHYHDIYGNPLINYEKFPSMFNMTSYAHILNLTCGWYANNCACSDHCHNVSECHLQIQSDVKALLQYGYDSLKIDGCGNETDLIVWNQYIEYYTKKMNVPPIVVENCHGDNPKFKPNRTLPPAIGCPYHFYRVSKDIRNNYASIMSNLQMVEPYHKLNESYPGCWAYPDMLQIGIPIHKSKKDKSPVFGLNLQETRTHFGAWAIVSSPLILSHDVNDPIIMDMIWPVIANREVLGVNQVYAGDSGGIYNKSKTNITLWYPNGKNHVQVPTNQYLYKPIDTNGQVAVLLINSANTSQTLVANFNNIPNVTCTTCHVRDIWNHKDLGLHTSSWSTKVESHDAAFIILKPYNNDNNNKQDSLQIKELQ